MRPGKVRAHGSAAPKECANGPAVLNVWDAAVRGRRATSAVKRGCPGKASNKYCEASLSGECSCQEP